MNASVEFLKDPLVSAASAGVMAFAADDATRTAIMAAAPNAIVHDGGIQSAISVMSQQEAPEILVVDFAEIETPDAALRSLRTLCGPATRIIGIGTINDVHLFHSVLNAGASDYLLKPLSAENMAQSLEQVAVASASAPNAKNRCRTVLVTGARGGAGTSSLVTGIAWHLAEKVGKNVALVDLDLLFGTVALGFDLEPSHGLREILENPHRVDSLFIDSAVVHATEKLSILAAEELFENPPDIRDGAMELLIDELGKNAGCIFIDIPSPLLVSHPEILNHADHIVVVSEMKLAAIRDVMRLKTFIQDSGRALPMSVIANKVTTRENPEVSLKEFSRGIGMAVEFALPWDPKSATEAAKAGRAVTDSAPKSALSKAIAEAAIFLSGHTEEDKNGGKSFWTRLMKKG